MSQRRSLGGARREATERVVIRGSGVESDAWTLNVSRGGLRLIVEDPIAVGRDYQVSVGDEAARPARAVWVREELDGQIVGMQYLDLDGGSDRNGGADRNGGSGEHGDAGRSVH